jgi:hypothetical protein
MKRQSSSNSNITINNNNRNIIYTVPKNDAMQTYEGMKMYHHTFINQTADTELW